MIALSPRQSDLLAFLERYIAEHHGVAPSYQEMCDHLGLKSRGGAMRLLDGLEERGRIRRVRGRHRAIEIIEPGLPLASFTTEQLRGEIARREAI